MYRLLHFQGKFSLNFFNRFGFFFFFSSLPLGRYSRITTIVVIIAVIVAVIVVVAVVFERLYDRSGIIHRNASLDCVLYYDNQLPVFAGIACVYIIIITTIIWLQYGYHRRLFSCTRTICKSTILDYVNVRPLVMTPFVRQIHDINTLLYSNSDPRQNGDEPGNDDEEG